VLYPSDDELADRALVARARRETVTP
jgi:hypothetical protein